MTHTQGIVTGLALLAAVSAASGQDLRENASRSLFSDQKASRVGDAVTILVVESSSASNDASTEASRASDLSLNAAGQVGDNSLPTVSAGVGTTNGFRGEGGTSTRGNLRAKISAVVQSVLPNGNLVVQGKRKIIINNEEQEIRISGVVRPSDILADNSVYSFNVSEAEIAFEGSGMVSRSQGPGWITKFLHWLF
jgi:flagellar L-ring protein precursor FlgH